MAFMLEWEEEKALFLLYSVSTSSGRGAGAAQLVLRRTTCLTFLSTEFRPALGPPPPAAYPMGTGSSFPGVKWPRLEANHSSPPSA
jgi:hypothetical protein